MAGGAERRLTDDFSREWARRVRDGHWRIAERAAENGTVWVCWWNKNHHFDAANPPPADTVVCGLIDGLELLEWLGRHPDWWEIGEWSDERYAGPVTITEAGRAALANRAAYDMEDVHGGLTEPGYVVTPAEAQP
jgi:hypothetical protein